VTTPTTEKQLAGIRRTGPGVTITAEGHYPHRALAVTGPLSEFRACVAVRIRAVPKGRNQAPVLEAEPVRDHAGRLYYAMPGGGRVAL